MILWTKNTAVWCPVWFHLTHTFLWQWVLTSLLPHLVAWHWQFRITHTPEVCWGFAPKCLPLPFGGVGSFGCLLQAILNWSCHCHLRKLPTFYCPRITDLQYIFLIRDIPNDRFHSELTYFCLWLLASTSNDYSLLKSIPIHFCTILTSHSLSKHTASYLRHFLTLQHRFRMEIPFHLSAGTGRPGSLIPPRLGLAFCFRVAKQGQNPVNSHAITSGCSACPNISMADHGPLEKNFVNCLVEEEQMSWRRREKLESSGSNLPAKPLPFSPIWDLQCRLYRQPSREKRNCSPQYSLPELPRPLEESLQALKYHAMASTTERGPTGNRHCIWAQRTIHNGTSGAFPSMSSIWRFQQLIHGLKEKMPPANKIRYWSAHALLCRTCLQWLYPYLGMGNFEMGYFDERHEKITLLLELLEAYPTKHIWCVPWRGKTDQAIATRDYIPWHTYLLYQA